MRILLFLTHFAMLLFSAYFYFNFDVRWVQVIGYNLAFNEPVANRLISILNLLPLPLLAISFLLFFNVFVAALRCCYGWRKLGYSGNIYLL